MQVSLYMIVINSPGNPTRTWLYIWHFLPLVFSPWREQEQQTNKYEMKLQPSLHSATIPVVKQDILSDNIGF